MQAGSTEPPQSCTGVTYPVGAHIEKLPRCLARGLGSGNGFPLGL